MSKISLKEFKEKIKNLCWDDFMMIYQNRSLYDEERQKVIDTEHGRRCTEFNRYMCF
jgi:hypothetical protein